MNNPLIGKNGNKVWFPKLITKSNPKLTPTKKPRSLKVFANPNFLGETYNGRKNKDTQETGLISRENSEC